MGRRGRTAAVLALTTVCLGAALSAAGECE